MKTIALAATVACLLVSGAARAEDEAMPTVHQFVDAVNAGDMKKAAATHLKRSPIVDEFAPYRWNTFGAWLGGFMADAKKNKVSDVHLTLLAPTTSTLTGNTAYEVVPNVIDAKHDGQPAQEKGIFAFALIKTKHGWRIASWSWAKQ